MTATYRTLAEPFEAEITERKSRFICHVAPVSTEDEALAVLADVRSRHPEARHNVWAYLLRDGRERCSDDGEPQKTAGLPTLEVLRRSELTDLVAVTTRYFGGTLLGTGGLVRAYTEAVQAALAGAPVAEYTSCVTAECRLPYARYEQVLRLAEDAGGKRAYTEAVQAALAGAPVAEYTSCVTAECRLPYARYEQVLRLAEDAGGKSLGADFGADVLLRVLFKEGDAPAFAATVRELARGEELCELGEARFCRF